MQSVDLLIIGGGINGTAIACEAASRGLNTLLAEARDISGGASSSTTGLLSAGLRQLETLDWDSVKRALNEQALLRERAPHLIHCREFHIAPNPGVRSNRRIKAGLYLYNLIQSTEVQQPLAVNTPELYLKPAFNNTLTFNDCTVSDTRLTLSNALLARDLGADIRTRHKVVEARRQGGVWQVRLQPGHCAQTESVQAKALINAGGWHVNDILHNTLHLKTRCSARLLRGDHIVIRKPYAGQQAYVLQAENKRLIYLLPYTDDFAVLGATQTPMSEDKNHSTQQLLDIYNHYFYQPIKESDIVHHYSGVHALYDDPTCRDADKSPDYLLDLNCPDGNAPLLSVFGGWLTTHRLLAEQALDILQPYTRAPINRDLKHTLLPGGEIAEGNPKAFVDELQQAYPHLDKTLLQRLGDNYGTLSYQILGDSQYTKDLGHHFGCGLYGAEVRYLCHNEWAQTAEDILWRRTKLGLRMSDAEKAQLAEWLTYSFE